MAMLDNIGSHDGYWRLRAVTGGYVRLLAVIDSYGGYCWLLAVNEKGGMDQSNIMKNHMEKPEKFKGSDFYCWQQKMLFYLTTLHVSNVLTKDEPSPPIGQDGAPPSQRQVAAHQRAIDAWRTNEHNCRNYILNALDDSLYDIYSTFGTTCEIWESLDSKYKTEATCSKRFVVGKFLNYRMVDGKPVMKQVEELQVLSHELEVEGMGINNNFLVWSIIDKLPHTWKNFKLYLKHLSEDITFEQLVLKLRVEEDNRLTERTDALTFEPNANMVEGSTSRQKFPKFKGKQPMTKRPFNYGKGPIAPKRKTFKTVIHCWVCGKPGHRAKDC
ncbi:uncharacterized protein LOC112504107 [Cynara cardunculus var. scolymus]|uniref:uncharacterized protein LOC112504107 n=1 Tax=Cynara cardunculus var. scolymus TaxID=59895 RepID=UPI000D622F13|nr:uncharacterized protein LOC112504107 [Cynara cardunculus var. scolymus]